jgi:hypothetical protein
VEAHLEALADQILRNVRLTTKRLIQENGSADIETLCCRMRQTLSAEEYDAWERNSLPAYVCAYEEVLAEPDEIV